MSQQINLLNVGFRKSFDVLAATSVATITGLLLLIILTVTAFSWQQTEARKKVADQLDGKLKTAQEKLTALAKSIAENKPSPQLEAEVANARNALKSREQLLKLLEGGGLGYTSGFAGYLLGLARQVPSGLWLTSFSIGAGGNDMEIRGRMLSPPSLAEYIRRLSTEEAFKGRSFSALTIVRPDEAKARTGAPATQQGYLEFVLTPGTPNPAKPEATPAKPAGADAAVAEKKS